MSPEELTMIADLAVAKGLDAEHFDEQTLILRDPRSRDPSKNYAVVTLRAAFDTVLRETLGKMGARA